MRHVRLSVVAACFAVLLALALPSLLTARQSASLTVEDLAALTFRTIGPANMSGRFVDMAVVESDPYVFYVASSTGGMYKTTDNGVTFTPVFEREGTHSLGDVEIFQPNPSIVWVGTGERANRQSTSWGDGVHKSTDAGRTWANMGLKDSHSRLTRVSLPLCPVCAVRCSSA